MHMEIWGGTFAHEHLHYLFAVEYPGKKGMREDAFWIGGFMVHEFRFTFSRFCANDFLYR